MSNNLIKHVLLIIALLAIFSACGSPKDDVKYFLSSGHEYLEKGEYSKAIIEFKNALQIDKDLVSAWYGLSIAEEKQGHLDKVYYTLNKVVELEPSNVEAQLKLGKIILAGNVLDKALKKSDLLLSLAPNDPNVRAFRALVLFELSDKEGAKKEANNALKIEPHNIDAITVLALEKLSKNDLQGAISYIDKGLHYDDKNIALKLLKIKVLNMSNDKEGVINVFNILIAQYPENKNFQLSLAEYYIKNGFQVRAEKIYTSAVAKYPEDNATKQKYIQFLTEAYGIDKAISQLTYYITANPNDNELKFQLADLYIYDKNYKNAENVYKQIAENISSNPNDLTTNNKLALLALLLENISDAVRINSKVLEIDSDNEDALLIRAKINIKKNKIDNAIIDLRALIDNNSQNVAALLLLAEAYQMNYSIELAKESYNRALQVDPLNESTIIQYSNFLIQFKKIDLAEGMLVASLEKSPHSILIMKELAQVYLLNGKWLKAHEIATYIKDSGDNVIADQILGAVYQGQRQFDLSVEAFKRAYQASPLNEQPMIAVVRSYVMAGKRDEAISFLESVVDIDPTNIYANVLLGQGYEFNNDKKKAEEHFKKAIESNANNPLGYIELARFYSEQSNYINAVNTLEKALEKLPDNLSINLAIARVQEQAGNIDRAIMIYENILNYDSNIEVASNNLASLLSENYNDEKSLKRAYNLAIKFENSSNPYFRDTLGWVYYKMGNTEKATSLLQTVVNSMPGVSIFHFHLGMSLLAEQKKDLARIELEKAISIIDQTFVDKSIAENALKKL